MARLELRAPPHPVILDYQGAVGLDDLLENISGVAVDGQSLWTVSDEGRTVERLAATGDGYRLAEQLDLDDYFPTLPPGKEADLEAVDVAARRLWVCGSHCRVRRKPLDDGRLNVGFRRRASRYLLGAIPVDGTTSTRRNGSHALPFLGPGSLRRRLREDALVAPFISIAGKENGLDIEGLAVFGDRLLLGLRGPVIDGFAVVVEFSLRVGGSIGNRKAVRHLLDLKGLGVRDLTLWGDHVVVLAGPVTAADGPFRLHLWRPAADQRPQLAPEVRTWPIDGERPEGVCRLVRDGVDGLLVVYDSPDRGRIDGARYTADWFEATLQ